MTCKRFVEIPCQITYNPVPPGFPIAELEDFLSSKAFMKRQGSLLTRRLFVVGAVASCCSLPRGALAQMPLIGAAISALTLVKTAFEVAEHVKGALGFGGSASGPKSGGVLQDVRNSSFVEQSQTITVQIPAGMDINIQFVGPAPATRQANQFTSTTSVNTRRVPIQVR